MAKSFDPSPLLGTLPSFYREHLDGTSSRVLFKVWEALTRAADAEYAHITQTSRSNKLGRAEDLTLYPWVYEEFKWESQQVRHQHAAIEATSTDDKTFYLGRYVDPAEVELYYDGVRVDTTTRDIITNDPGAAQIAGTSPAGTRVVFDQARTPSGKPLFVWATRELFVSQNTTNGSGDMLTATWFDGSTSVAAEVDQDSWEVSIDAQDITAETTITNNGTLAVTVSAASIQSGSLVEVITASGVTAQKEAASGSVTFTFSAVQTVTSVRIRLDIPVYPPQTKVSESLVTLGFPAPQGLVVRVVDPSGTQSFTLDAGDRSIMLDQPVDPGNTEVFILGFDILKPEVTSSSFKFQRAPSSGLVFTARAAYELKHDHARHTEAVTAATSVISLPATRPVVLTSAGAEDPRYPIRVFHNGALLAKADYTLTDNVTLTKAAGTFSPGDVVDVVYADGEAPAQHKHLFTSAFVPAGKGFSSIELAEAPGSRYPALVSYTGVGSISPTIVAVSGKFAALPAPIVPGSAVNTYSSIAVYRKYYKHDMPARSVPGESYRGVVIQAASLGDGVDKPSAAEVPVITATQDGATIESDISPAKGWLKNVYVDERRIQGVLGEAVGLMDPGLTSKAYKDAVLAHYAAYYGGSRLADLESLACVILGSAYSPVDAVVTGIDSEEVLARAEDGTSITLKRAQDVPLRITGTDLGRLEAISAHCTFIDSDLSGIPYLAFMAEKFSDTYRYAKRLDVSTPVEVSSSTFSFDNDTQLLTDNTTDFIAREVRAGDLIRFSTQDVSTGSTANTPNLSFTATNIYAFVVRVINSHTVQVAATLSSQGYGYGGSGYGGVDGSVISGYGGLSLLESIASYTIWARRTRTIDIGMYQDEMLDKDVALASGESVQATNSALNDILRHFVFAVRLRWIANSDTERKNYLKHFLDTAKPADTQYIAYTTVNDDDGIKDTTKAALTETNVAMSFPLRTSYTGSDSIGSFFIP